MGHEERFPPPKLSVSSGFRKETIAGLRHNGREAPTPAVRPTTTSRHKSTLSGPFMPPAGAPAHAPRADLDPDCTPWGKTPWFRPEDLEHMLEGLEGRVEWPDRELLSFPSLSYWEHRSLLFASAAVACRHGAGAVPRDESCAGPLARLRLPPFFVGRSMPESGNGRPTPPRARGRESLLSLV